MPQKEDRSGSRKVDKLMGTGASLTARMLPNNVFEISMEINSPPELALEMAFSILSREGKITEDRRSDPKEPAVCAAVGSGIWNLNPALVEVKAIPVSEDTTRVLITGTAKEGLIKQHAGEKAARRIADLLAHALV